MSANTKIKNSVKPQLVLLHGWGMNASVWQSINPRLASYFHVTSLDLPGYGMRRDERPDTLAETAACIARQISEPAILLGWSLGGLIALQVACDFPEKITHLITVAASPCFTSQANWDGLDSAVLIKFQQQLAQNVNRTLDRFIGLQTLGTLSGLSDSRFLRKQLQTSPLPNIAVLQHGLQLLQHSDLRDVCAQIACPVLTIYGALDPIVPHEIAKKLQFQHPDSNSYQLSEAGHVPFLSNPEQVITTIVDFISNNSA